MNAQRVFLKQISRTLSSCSQNQTLRATATSAAANAAKVTASAKEEVGHRQRTLLQATSTVSQLSCTSRHMCKFTAAAKQLGEQISVENAQDLICNLKDSERAAIKVALEKYDALKQKETFEGKLAATQWRTRFGRRAAVPDLGSVDPTGTFCAFPENWLKKKAAERALPPSKSDLTKIFFVNAVPFVGFGFLDNFVMIIAGEYIEASLNAFMCISTMAAAGLGNTLSDVLGIGTAFYIERGCEIMGLKPPDLTPVQLEMKSSRSSANMGRIIGITIGCLLGMTPLLFMEKAKSEEEETAEK